MNLFGLDRRVNRYLQKFEREYISFQQMKEIVLDTYEPFKIKWKKKNGVNAERDMYTVFGPSGKAMNGVEYWKAPYNYMIAYDIDKAGFRTIRLEEVDWVEKEGQRFYLKK